MFRTLCRGGVWALAIIALGGLAGCASTGQRQLVRLAGTLHDTQLRKIASTAELDQLVRDGEALTDLRRQIALQRACREHPSGPQRPWGCDKHRTARNGKGDASVLDSITVTGSRIRAADLITRNQEAGVDEGDIVKKSGDFIIVLHKGVLHSIRISRNGAPVLERADTIRVAVDASGKNAWYDEILTFGSRLILLGFNYGADDQEAAELVLFDLGSDGRFRRDGRYWIRTQDYFSGSNYATRIQGDNLLMTMSLRLDLQGEMAWPEWSRRDVAQPAWTPLIDVEQLYFPIYTSPHPYVHLLLQCPIAKLGGAGLDCRTTGIIGAGSSVFYASDNAAYLAMPAWGEAAYEDPEFDEWSDEPKFQSLRQTAVFRVPYAATQAPTLARVNGRVDDQLWFKEDAGGLYVTTREAAGEHTHLALSRIPAASFRPSLEAVIAPNVLLPVADGQDMVRYSDTSVWVGTHRYSLEEETTVSSTDVLVQPLSGAAASVIRVPHSADRLEPAFGGMIIAGTRGAAPWEQPAGTVWGVSFATEHSAAQVRSTLEIPQHLSSEGRTHAFNLGQLSNGTRLFGMPGWPKEAVPAHNWDPEVVSDLLFMRLDGEQIRPAGVVSMQDAPQASDCEDSCYDWYGNARLFFVGDRMFALSANLFKEARYRRGMVREVRRVELL
jgi:Beta propeller domain